MSVGIVKLCLVLTLLHVLQVSCQSCGVKTIGEATPASFQDTLDTGTGFGYLVLDDKYKFDCCGVVTTWHTVIGALGTVKFQIWRANGAQFELVGENPYSFSTADQLTEQTLGVPSGNMITVLSGDYIGWYTQGTDMIPYKGAAGSGTKRLSMAAPSVSASKDWTSASSLNLRTYAVNAKTKANATPTINQLPLTLTYADTDTITAATVFHTVTVTDTDLQDVATLTTAMTTTSSLFSFTSNEVKATVANWAVGTYPLDFTVTDQCSNQGTGTLTIEITNTAPDMTAMATAANVNEDVSVQTSLTDLTVTDFQTYTCTYSGSDPFNVQPKTTGSTTYALFLNGEANLNYNTKNQYTVSITCTDDLGLSTTKDVVVSINENTPPTATNLPGTVDVDTLTAVTGTEVFTVTGTDPDSTNLCYNMTCTPTGCPFQILCSGKILTTEDMNLHKTPAYNLNVWVNDGYSVVGPSTLAVTVLNINDKPVINNLPSGLTLTVPENSPVSTTILQASVTDSNAGDTHTWTGVFTPAEGANYLRIVSSSGSIKPSSVIDYEELLANGVTSFNVAVTADDGRETSDTKYITVQVTDVNEQQTGFSQSTFQISGVETTTTFTDPNPTIAASVIDPDDTRDTQTFTMDCGANTGLFSMNPTTGRVTKSAEYDLDVSRKTTETIACVVTATDLASHTITADLNIVINEENDNPPVLNKETYTYFLPINTAAGTQFGSCTSTDDDVQTAHTDTTYTLSGSSQFGITNNCAFYNNVNFSTTTHQVGDSFSMNLIARNDNGLQDTAVVNVILTEIVTTAAPVTTTTTAAAATAPSFGGGSGSSFLDDPENLGWFIPLMILFAAMLALLGYMIYRCIRYPGAFAKLGKLCKSRRFNCKWPKRSKRTAKMKVTKNKKPKIKENKVRQLGNNDGKYEWNIWSHSDFNNTAVEHR